MDKKEPKKEVKVLKNTLKLLGAITIPLILLLAYNNKNMVAKFYPSEISTPTTENVTAKDNFARASLFYNQSDDLPQLENNCGVRSVYVALRMIRSKIDTKPFLDYQTNKVGVLGLSAGMMEEFLETIGVQYQAFKTGDLSEKEYLNFLINGITKGKIPIVLIQNDLGFHWIVIRAVGSEDSLEPLVEFIADIEEKIDGQVLSRRSIVFREPFKDFHKKAQFTGIAQSTFMIGVPGRTTNHNQ